MSQLTGKIPVDASNDAKEIVAKAPDQSKVVSKLIFNSILFESTTKGVQPNFKCPVCGGFWQPKLDLTDADKTVVYDLNKLFSFKIPAHLNGVVACSLQEQTVELFIAVHKDKDGTACCIQKSNEEGTAGISADWWKPAVSD